MENTPIRLNKSSACKALEKAAKNNNKISDWIVRNSEELKIKEFLGDTCTPPQVEGDGVNKSKKEPETSVVGLEVDNDVYVECMNNKTSNTKPSFGAFPFTL